MFYWENIEENTEEMTSMKANLWRLEGHKLETLSKVVELVGELSEEVRETFSDEGAQISKWGKDIEPKEEVEAEEVENQEAYKDTPYEESRIQKLEEMVAQLQ